MATGGNEERELLAALGDIKEQLSVLGLKQLIACDNISDDLEGLGQLKEELGKIETNHGSTLDRVVRSRDDAMGPSMLAQLRRPAAMPFRKDTK
jgi:hypothetical protein